MSKVLIDRKLLERIAGKLPLGADYDDVWDLLQYRAKPAADCGLEVVGYASAGGLQVLTSIPRTGSVTLRGRVNGVYEVPLVRKSDADARIAGLEKLAAAISNDCNTVANERNDMRARIAELEAQLSAIKAQEPVFMWHKGATDDESEVVDVDCACPCCVPLYAAPFPVQANNP